MQRGNTLWGCEGGLGTALSALAPPPHPPPTHLPTHPLTVMRAGRVLRSRTMAATCTWTQDTGTHVEVQVGRSSEGVEC